MISNVRCTARSVRNTSAPVRRGGKKKTNEMDTSDVTALLQTNLQLKALIKHTPRGYPDSFGLTLFVRKDL